VVPGSKGKLSGQKWAKGLVGGEGRENGWGEGSAKPIGKASVEEVERTGSSSFQIHKGMVTRWGRGDWRARFAQLGRLQYLLGEAGSEGGGKGLFIVTVEADGIPQEPRAKKRTLFGGGTSE